MKILFFTNWTGWRNLLDLRFSHHHTTMRLKSSILRDGFEILQCTYQIQNNVENSSFCSNIISTIMWCDICIKIAIPNPFK